MAPARQAKARAAAATTPAAGVVPTTREGQVATLAAFYAKHDGSKDARDRDSGTATKHAQTQT